MPEDAGRHVANQCQTGSELTSGKAIYGSGAGGAIQTNLTTGAAPLILTALTPWQTHRHVTKLPLPACRTIACSRTNACPSYRAAAEETDGRLAGGPRPARVTLALVVAHARAMTGAAQFAHWRAESLIVHENVGSTELKKLGVLIG